jgi:phosphoribosylformylglycinamidine synthase
MALAGRLGAKIEAPLAKGPLHGWLFGEDQARYILTCAPEAEAAILTECAALNVPCQKIGMTGGLDLVLPGEPPLSLAQMSASQEDWLPHYMTEPIDHGLSAH